MAGSAVGPVALARRGAFFVNHRHAGRHGGGTITVGQMYVEYEIPADVRLRTCPLAPMNNAPGTVVTMMNQAHVRHVLIAGQFKVRDGRLLGWNIERLLNKVERSRERVLRRINGRCSPAPSRRASTAKPIRTVRTSWAPAATWARTPWPRSTS